MKKGWQRKTLGEVCSFQRGLTYKKSDEYSNLGQPILRSNNVNLESGDLNLDDIKYINPNIQVLPKNHVKRGTILVCMANGSKKHLGKSCLIKTDEKYIVGGFMGLLLPNDHIYAPFLNYTLRNNEYRNFINQLADGSNINNLKFSQLSNYPINLPPLEEQKRIVSLLDEAFANLDRAQAHIQANRKNADDLRISILNLKITSIIESGCAEKSLGDCVQFIDYRGKTPPKTSHGIPLITAKNVKAGYIQKEPEEFIDETAYEKWMTRGFPKQGDVLFTTEAPLGNVAQLNISGKVVIGQRLITFKTKEFLDDAYLKYVLLSPSLQKEIFKNATGATVQGIKAKLLKKILIPIPSLEEQQHIVSLLDQASSHCTNLEEKYKTNLQNIAELRQSLLQQAFAGALT